VIEVWEVSFICLILLLYDKVLNIDDNSNSRILASEEPNLLNPDRKIVYAILHFFDVL